MARIRQIAPDEVPPPAQLDTPTDLSNEARQDVPAALNALLADTFALYLKTKNFHWHVSGPHFRDYHLLLDEHAEQILGLVDVLAERVRKIGGTTLRSIGHVLRLQRIADNDALYVEANAMLLELLADNRDFAQNLRAAKEVCDEDRDFGSAALIETFLDETEKRIWFLFEATQTGDRVGR